jgi:hypothetical protein
MTLRLPRPLPTGYFINTAISPIISEMSGITAIAGTIKGETKDGKIK